MCFRSTDNGKKLMNILNLGSGNNPITSVINISRSQTLFGNAFLQRSLRMAFRNQKENGLFDAERRGMHSQTEFGNEGSTGTSQTGTFNTIAYCSNSFR
jgi:hypothetical protein